MPKQIDPDHSQTRDTLRVLGPITIVVGLIFILIGGVDFFAAFGSMRPPQYFWCLFLGMPLFALGSSISKFAYLGAVSRYMANEVAPVSKDVTNYLVQETKGSVRDLAAAVGQGVITGMNSANTSTISCSKCSTENEASANFCKSCGTSLKKSAICASCGETNDGDARYCDNCGKPIA